MYRIVHGQQLNKLIVYGFQKMLKYSLNLIKMSRIAYNY